MSPTFDTVRLTRENIQLDGVVLPGGPVATNVRVDSYGADLHKVTFSVYAREIELASHPMFGCNVEIHDHDEEPTACERNYTAPSCTHVYRDGTRVCGDCDE